MPIFAFLAVLFILHVLFYFHAVRHCTISSEIPVGRMWAKTYSILSLGNKYDGFSMLLNLRKLLLKTNAAIGESVLLESNHLGLDVIEKCDKEYVRIIRKACRGNPVQENAADNRGWPKHGKILSMIDRFRDYKKSVCLFVRNFAVPFDNNQANHSFRMIKVKATVSGCFRKEEGATDFLKIMSYTEMAKKQGVNSFHAILLDLSSQARAYWQCF